MSRFWITPEKSVDFVLQSLEECLGGEIFVPKIPSMRIAKLAKVIAPNIEPEVIGLRPGEKLHEVMITDDDAHHTVELPDRYVTLPSFSQREAVREHWLKRGKPCNEGFCYTSDTNPEWLSAADIAGMISQLDLPEAHRWREQHR